MAIRRKSSVATSTKLKRVKKVAKVDKQNPDDRQFDKTQLKSTGAGQTVHRDYAAHCFRWGFASNFINRQKLCLDVGCGQEMPMIRCLTRSVGTIPKHIVGVDLNKISKPFNAKWCTIKDEFNVIDRWKELRKEFGKFDVITNFEVIEHMQKSSGKKMLKAFFGLLADEGQLILSTPVFNGRAAKNHIHEYEEQELEDMIEATGFTVTRKHGTFASWNDMKKVITAQERELMEELHKFYTWEVLSCFLAPKYPSASRNITWILTK